MKQFVYLYYGFWEPTKEVMDAWGAWFGAVGDKFVDSGNPFGGGKLVTNDGSTDLGPDANPAMGYSVVNAEDMDEALSLLDGCPIVHSVQVYEAMPM